MSTTRRIEIAGVAGAGKSTLARALCARHAGFRIADSLHTREPGHWPYVAHGAPGLLPLLVGSLRRRPALSWDEVKLVIYASEWDRYLGSGSEGPAEVLVLDQGPLFAVARLLWGAKPVTRGDAFGAWTERTLERWCSGLDAVVWLDAPDDTLLERIDRRSKPHEAKGASSADGLHLIVSHRVAYERALEVVDRVASVPVLRYDTGTSNEVELSDELAATVRRLGPRRLTDARSATNVS